MLQCLMQKLVPFAVSAERISVQGSLAWEGELLVFRAKLEDPGNLVMDGLAFG